MSNQISASGQITITRLRTGETLSFLLRSSRVGVPFAQFIDTNSKTVTPSWEEDANRPELTPEVRSASGKSVVLTAHQWKYNGTLLTFGGAVSGEWTTSSGSYAGYFAMKADGTIRPLKNLASADNPADDTLEYFGTASVQGVEQQVSGIYTVRISPSGSAAYMLSLEADRLMLDDENPSCNITASLVVGTGSPSSPTYAWKLNGKSISGNGATLTLNRSQIDYVGLVVCEASVGGKMVARSSVYVYDNADEYRLVITSNSGTVLGSGVDSLTLSARIVNTKTNSEVTPEGTASWSWAAYDHADADPVLEGSSATFSLTTAQLDAVDATSVDVVASVTYQ